MRAILTYHSIDDSESVVSLSPEVFQSHVDWFAEGSVAIVGLTELLALPEGTDAIAITFDDALACILTEVAPLLAAHALPAATFVVSDHAGGDNRWGGVADAGIPIQPVLNWDALGRLGEAGWSIGSHTRTHPHLTRCSDAELHDELEGSAETIRVQLGQQPATFAYPYGDCDPRVAVAAAACYDVACTTEHLPIAGSPERHLIPRLDAWYFRYPHPFRDWGSPRFRRGIAWRHAMRRVRRLLP